MTDLELSFYNFFRIATISLRQLNDHSNVANGDRHHPSFDLFPYDICTVIRAIARPPHNVLCVMVSSFIGKSTGRTSDRIVWLMKTSSRWDVLHELTNISIPLLKTPHQGDRHENDRPMNKGILSDGTRFLIYRFFLYSDGFNKHKSMSDTRSICGCYLMPVGFDLNYRKSSASARVLTLSQGNQDINDVLAHLVDDIVLGVTEGVEGIDPYGRQVRIFLDIISNVGDYPAASACGDLMGHTANAPCSVCAFGRRKGTTNG